MNTLTLARNAAIAHTLCDEFLTEIERSQRPRPFQPTADVQEIEGAYLVRLDLPGLSREDFTIETSDAALTISGTRRAPSHAPGYHFSETGYGPFHRAFSLPRNVDRNAIDARFENGVLEVKLARYAEAA